MCIFSLVMVSLMKKTLKTTFFFYNKTKSKCRKIWWSPTAPIFKLTGMQHKYVHYF